MLEGLRWFISWARGVRPPRLSIAVTETGFLLLPVDRPGRAAIHFQWEEVAEVLGYERDLLTYDLICLGVARGSTTVEIDEEATGWNEFIQAMEKNLPVSLPKETWWPAVAHPAFATNLTTVYQKEKQST